MQAQSTETSIQQDDWTLNTDQMIFMLQHHNQIEAAYTAEDMEFLRELSVSAAYRAVFGDMGFDEAYDRYECMLEAERGDS